MDKRERVIRTLELEEPDVVPIHSLGYDRTRKGYADFLKSGFSTKYKKNIEDVGNIAEIRWWNADIWQMDPFNVFKTEIYPSPTGYEDCTLHVTGRIYRTKPGVKIDPMVAASHIPWFEGGYFTSPERVHELWNAHGRPIDLLDENETYSKSHWDAFVDALSPWVYPMAWLTLSMHEALFQGVTPLKVAYFIRKDPGFIHELMGEYCKVNVEIVKRFADAGVDILFYSDDLGQHGRSLLSKKDFKTFILPYLRKLYDACKKQGMFIVQHTCGYVDDLVPLLVDAGLSCVQSLEPTAGVDLAGLKQQWGDKIAFMGGMDSSRTLEFGTLADVKENVEHCMEAAAAGGGYFAGPSHTILDAPWDNILAFRDAITKNRDQYG